MPPQPGCGGWNIDTHRARSFVASTAWLRRHVVGANWNHLCIIRARFKKRAFSKRGRCPGGAFICIVHDGKVLLGTLLALYIG